MRIEKDDIVIRSAVAGDAVLLKNWWNDGSVMEHAGFPKGLGTTTGEVLDRIAVNKESIGKFCVIEIDGKAVGELNYKIKEGIAYPGWKICEKDYQNKGYGTRIILMLLEFIFTDKKLNSSGVINCIRWDTMLENVRAQHVYENKIGAAKTAVVKNAWKGQLGVLRTAVNYEITREAFYKLHSDL